MLSLRVFRQRVKHFARGYTAHHKQPAKVAFFFDLCKGKMLFFILLAQTFLLQKQQSPMEA